MKFDIIKQIKNPSLCREEFFLKVTAEKSPSKKEVIDLIKQDEALCVVKQIRGSFGKEEFSVDIVVYDNEKAKNEIEVVGRKIRKKLEADAKKAEEEKKRAEVAK
jgi:ribosomal protein S24E